jgi:hypothetical protein
MSDRDSLVWRLPPDCESSSCVEMAETAEHVYLRHSEQPDGPTLRFTHHEWDVFLRAQLER